MPVLGSTGLPSQCACIYLDLQDRVVETRMRPIGRRSVINDALDHRAINGFVSEYNADSHNSGRRQVFHPQGLRVRTCMAWRARFNYDLAPATCPMREPRRAHNPQVKQRPLAYVHASCRRIISFPLPEVAKLTTALPQDVGFRLAVAGPSERFYTRMRRSGHMWPRSRVDTGVGMEGYYLTS